jgi:2-polyprenyl-6-methoxyphenol hydroxylase-like FAD-dependent oxidoreductase
VAAFCASLPSSGVSDALAGAERVSELRVYERTANFRRRYEDLAAAADGAGGLPAGIAVIGDACAAFNPVYGQGMSVAVLEAVDLGERLAAALPARCVGGSGEGADYAQQEREQRAAEARRALPAATVGFMRNIGAIVAVPWALATGNDAPYCPGFKRAPAEAAVNAVFEAVSRYSQRDVDVHNVVMRVMHMLDPPTAMVAPRVLWRFAVDAALRALRLRGSSPQAS